MVRVGLLTGSGTDSHQGWRGSVKARHLVMAIRDHFGQPSERAAAAQAHEAVRLEKIRAIVSHPGSSDDKVEAVAQAAGRTPAAVDETGERWAVSVITCNRMQVCSGSSVEQFETENQ
jgi:hypothetical protein